jgi:hypothetical protein
MASFTPIVSIFTPSKSKCGAERTIFPSLSTKKTELKKFVEVYTWFNSAYS